MTGKQAYERAYYLDEDIDETVFQDGCKYKGLYTRLKEDRARRQKTKTFSEIAENTLAGLEGREPDGSAWKLSGRMSPRTTMSHSSNVASRLLDKLEDKFDFHPMTMSKTDRLQLNADTEEVKRYIRSTLSDVHIPGTKHILDKIDGKKRTTDIINYLYQRVH